MAGRLISRGYPGIMKHSAILTAIGRERRFRVRPLEDIRNGFPRLRISEVFVIRSSQGKKANLRNCFTTDPLFVPGAKQSDTS